jgi:small conductance mechanosensitive channel
MTPPSRLLRPLTVVLLTCLLLLFPVIGGAESDSTLTREDIDRVLSTLEDDAQRETVIETLRALREATGDSEADAARASVKTAAAELVERIAQRAEDASGAATRLFDSVNQLPDALASLATQAEDPEARSRWVAIGGRLLAVLISGYLAALLIRVLLRRLRPSPTEPDLSVLRRLWLVSLRLVLDLIPIIALGLVAYGVLTAVDPRQETRLVAVALINASILSRLLIAVADFVLAPHVPALRLWPMADESAHYLYLWTKRLGLLSIYGFFGLQAAFLLGLDPDLYESLLRLLGFVILIMLLVLVAQNRHEVAGAIAPDRVPDPDEPVAMASLRRGVARVWHLLAAAYLVVIYGIWALRIQDGASYLLHATVMTIAAFAVGRFVVHAIDQLFDRGLRLSDELTQQYPALERRLNRYFPILRRLSKWFVGVAVLLFIGNAWGLNTLTWATEGSGRIFVNAILHILFVLAIAFVLWEFASGGIESYLAEKGPDGNSRARSARTRTLLTVARNALLVVLTVVTTLMILSELGINIAPLLAGAGVVGLAIGFGAQRLVQDVINGAFILFQDLMSVGDVVKLGDKAGVVEALSIRTVRLRDLAGVVHTIPFSSIEAVSNLTREYSFHVFDIGIAYRENVDEVIALLQSIGEELQSDPEIGPLMLEPLEVFGLDQFGDSAIVIKGRIKTLPIKQWAVGRAFNRLVKLRFDEHGIEIPFPHQTIYFGQDKDGSAPPAFVQMDRLLGATSVASPPPTPGPSQPS